MHVAVDQNIGVHYGELTWGGIGFAILEDRKWKSAPKTLLPGARDSKRLAAESGVEFGKAGRCSRRATARRAAGEVPGEVGTEMAR